MKTCLKLFKNFPAIFKLWKQQQSYSNEFIKIYDCNMWWILNRCLPRHHSRGTFCPFHAFISRALCQNTMSQSKSDNHIPENYLQIRLCLLTVQGGDVKLALISNLHNSLTNLNFTAKSYHDMHLKVLNNFHKKGM